MTFDEAVKSLQQIRHVLVLQDTDSGDLLMLDDVIDRWAEEDVIYVAEQMKSRHPEVYPN